MDLVYARDHRIHPVARDPGVQHRLGEFRHDQMRNRRARLKPPLIIRDEAALKALVIEILLFQQGQPDPLVAAGAQLLQNELQAGEPIHVDAIEAARKGSGAHRANGEALPRQRPVLLVGEVPVQNDSGNAARLEDALEPPRTQPLWVELKSLDPETERFGPVARADEKPRAGIEPAVSPCLQTDRRRTQKGEVRRQRLPARGTDVAAQRREEGIGPVVHRRATDSIRCRVRIEILLLPRSASETVMRETPACSAMSLSVTRETLAMNSSRERVKGEE